MAMMYIVAVKMYDDNGVQLEEPKKTFETFESYDRVLSYVKRMRDTHDRPDICIAKPIRVEERRKE